MSESVKSGWPDKLSPQFKLGIWILGFAFFVEAITSFLGMQEMGWSTYGKVHAFLQAVFGGVFLYWLRGRNRLLYGLLEVAFALFLLGFAIITHVGPPDFSQANIGYLAQIAAGIYVLIRGFDNTSQGFKSWAESSA
ncbi:hypothetical protein [Mesorhizobium sp. M0435]|uniref:hypothetical protein n=1 Tax=Mesorhizobium sp. M0435 TaxID=2956944 RepID=UPI003336C186